MPAIAKLTPRMLRLADAIASGERPEAAMQRLGIPRTTGRRWRRRADFEARVEAATASTCEADRATMASLDHLLPDAIQALARLLASDDEAIRLKAATTICNRVLGMPHRSVDVRAEVTAADALAHVARELDVPIVTDGGA